VPAAIDGPKRPVKNLLCWQESSSSYCGHFLLSAKVPWANTGKESSPASESRDTVVGPGHSNLPGDFQFITASCPPNACLPPVLPTTSCYLVATVFVHATRTCVVLAGFGSERQLPSAETQLLQVVQNNTSAPNSVSIYHCTKVATPGPLVCKHSVVARIRRQLGGRQQHRRSTKSQYPLGRGFACAMS
jgi:hypothetical protein